MLILIKIYIVIHTANTATANLLLSYLKGFEEFIALSLEGHVFLNFLFYFK